MEASGWSKYTAQCEKYFPQSNAPAQDVWELTVTFIDDKSTFSIAALLTKDDNLQKAELKCSFFWFKNSVLIKTRSTSLVIRNMQNMDKAKMTPIKLA